MFVFFRKIVFILFIAILCFVAVGFLPMHHSFLQRSLSDTQYEKIVWIQQKLAKKEFKAHYKAIFFGSSQCLYGINDSILGDDYLNLGMNTPSRDLDLFLVEQLDLHQIKADRYFQTIGGQSVVSYGTHKVMPFLVTPLWYIQHGQSMLSIHFWKFVLQRSGKVMQSWLQSNDNLKPYNSHWTGYGYRALAHTLSDTVKPLSQERFDACQSSFSWWTKIRSNTFSQTVFFNRFKLHYPTNYILMPSFETYSLYKQKQSKLTQCNGDTSILFMDSNSFAKLNTTSVWGDQGHLNQTGATYWSVMLLHLLKQ